MKKLIIEIPDDLHHILKVYAAKLDKSMKAIIIELISKLKPV